MAQRKSEAVVEAEQIYNSTQRETPYQLGYNLECLKVYGDNRLTVTSQNYYQNHAQDLTLNKLAQNVKESNGSSHSTVKISNYGSLIPRASLQFSLFYDYDDSTIELADYSVSNPSHIVGASMGMYYQYRGINLNLNLRLGYADKTLRDELKESHLRYADFAPSLSLKYVPLRNMTVHLDYNFTRTTPNIRMLHTVPILIGHRTSSSYEGELFLSSYHNIGSKITYKHVPSMLFTALNINYRKILPNRLFGSYLKGNEISMNTMQTEEQGQSLSASVSTSKGFYWKAMKIGVELMGVTTDMPILLQKRVLRQNSTNWLVSADFYMRPWQFLEVKINSQYSYLSNSLENGIEQSPLEYWRNRVGLTLNPTKRLHSSIGYFHYYNSNNQSDKNFHLCNLSVEYDFDRWSIYGKINNILDTQSYNYSYLSNVSRYDILYQLRPRSILIGVQFKIL